MALTGLIAALRTNFIPDVTENVVGNSDRQACLLKHVGDSPYPLCIRSPNFTDCGLADICVGDTSRRLFSSTVIGAAANHALLAEDVAESLDVADAVLQREQSGFRRQMPGRPLRQL